MRTFAKYTNTGHDPLYRNQHKTKVGISLARIGKYTMPARAISIAIASRCLDLWKASISLQCCKYHLELSSWASIFPFCPLAGRSPHKPTKTQRPRNKDCPEYHDLKRVGRILQPSQRGEAENTTNTWNDADNPRQRQRRAARHVCHTDYHLRYTALEGRYSSYLLPHPLTPSVPPSLYQAHKQAGNPRRKNRSD